MKQIIKHIRETIAYKLINITVSILPASGFKYKYCQFLYDELSKEIFKTK